MNSFNYTEHPHRRFNPLLNEWILVSPQRANRPWQGQQEAITEERLAEYVQDCYLCPGNKRSNGDVNESYDSVYVFNNDFPALLNIDVSQNQENNSFFLAEPEQGINKVICFSPKHNITLPEMEISQIYNVIKIWQSEYRNLGGLSHINNVQIFENKGETMGCSNPHPHCQIWAQKSIPTLIKKMGDNFKIYFDKNQKNMLLDYLEQELIKKERIVSENKHFAVLVPFWAVWPFETMIIPKRNIPSIDEMQDDEAYSYAEILKIITAKYDNLFETSFPYSGGIHQAPTDKQQHPEWLFHHHFYPPLLRSSKIKKFMVGYELMAEPQRDITPEKSAEILRNLPNEHYKTKI
ncbi:MAG: UDP-glucose--hexose-1-phosphate uridylyltransferase [Bergeyella sp.]